MVANGTLDPGVRVRISVPPPNFYCMTFFKNIGALPADFFMPSENHVPSRYLLLEHGIYKKTGEHISDIMLKHKADIFALDIAEGEIYFDGKVYKFDRCLDI